MPKKRHSPEEIVGKLRQVDVITSQGRSLGEAIRAIGVAEATYHRWREPSMAGSNSTRSAGSRNWSWRTAA